MALERQYFSAHWKTPHDNRAAAFPNFSSGGRKEFSIGAERNAGDEVGS